MSSVALPYKLLIIGDFGVGKTTFLKQRRTGHFEQSYRATMGLEVNKLTVVTGNTTTVFNTWDCAGKPEYSGLASGYYTQADAAIIMFDVTRQETYTGMNHWYKELWNMYGNPDGTCRIPIVVCGNKVDCKDREMMPSDIKADIEIQDPLCYQYYDISVRSGFAIDKPLEYIVRKLAKPAVSQDKPPIVDASA